jgi:phosphomannomutase
MSVLIISVSGLRGIVGKEFSPLVAARYAGAFAAGVGPGPLVLTRDGRATGRMLADVLRGTLCALGRKVIDADVAATPTTGVLIRQHHAAGGMQISASHNPPAYNGIKLFGNDGRVISAQAGATVLQRYESGDIPWVTHDAVGEAESLADTTSQHLRLVLETVDVDRIRRHAFCVLLDANHGAGGRLGQLLLAELGCQVTVLGAQPTGQFQHPPEPVAENLAGVCDQVVRAKVDVGFCQDPDADRLAVIDQTGRYLGEEYTLALCLDHVLRQEKGAVVTNCSTSRMARDLAAQYGVPFHLSKVGEAHVAEVMQDHEAVFGGEGNGGPIDPKVGLVRDSFVGMARVLDAMAARQLPVSALADQLPRYEILKTKVSIRREDIPAAIDRLEHHFSDAQADRLDGLRLDWPDKWLLVRASNTEPIVRLVAEARQAADAAALCQEAAGVLGR